MRIRDRLCTVVVIYLLHNLAHGSKFQVPSEHQHRDWNKAAQLELEAALNSKALITTLAKNVILFLGDGLGLTTVWASRIYTGQRKDRSSGEEYEFNFDKLPWTGLAKTYNVDYQVPDSAATATAFLCGVKANAGTVGVNQDTTRKNCSSEQGNSVDSIIQWSHKKGKSTGIVVTSRVTHATPAAAYAHSCERDWESDRYITDGVPCRDIARQLVEDNKHINVILGGGAGKFQPVSAGGQRTDGRDLLDEWSSHMNRSNKSYVLADTYQKFKDVDPQRTDYLLGLLAKSHLDFELDKDPTQQPTLQEMTRKAIQILQKNDNGFFLLVEGSRIDHAHHEGRAQKAFSETWEFDKAIGEALQMTDPEDTLIIVTADHSHAFATGGYPRRGSDIVGPISDLDYRNEPALDDLPYLPIGYLNGPGGPIGTPRRNVRPEDTTAKDYQIPAMVPSDDETHGGEDVPIYASGPWAHLLSGVHEQNYIAHVMAYASCVDDANKMCVDMSHTAANDQPSSSPGMKTLPHLVAGLLLLALL